jgi:hypothetical protein
VRRVKRHQQLASDGTGQGELLATHRRHAFIANSTLSMIEADERHRDHAIIEQTIAELKEGPLARLAPRGSTPPAPRGPPVRCSRSTSLAPLRWPPTWPRHAGPACARRSSRSPPGSRPPHDAPACTCPATGHEQRSGTRCGPPPPGHPPPPPTDHPAGDGATKDTERKSRCRPAGERGLYSSGRRALPCADLTSGRSGMLPALRQAPDLHFSRSEAYGRDARSGYRREPQGVDGAPGRFEHARSADLPARDTRPRPTVGWSGTPSPSFMSVGRR